MKGNVTSLNSQERQITESYLQYRTTALTTAEIELMEVGEARYLFTPHVFRMILPEVVTLMLTHNVSTDSLYPEIIKQARYAIRRDGLYPDDYNLPVGVAVLVIWLDFCCDYKSYGKVYKLKGEERGYKNNKRDLQFVVFFWCMNYGLGYATGKAKKMQEVFLSRINIEAKVQKERVPQQDEGEISEELNAFWELMHTAGFYYTKSEIA